MSVDVINLRSFYASSLGLQVTASLKSRLARLGYGNGKMHRAEIGLGYPLPLFETDKGKGQSDQLPLVMMPARQGALIWPQNSTPRVCLVEDDALPLANASVNSVIAMHLIENSGDPLMALSEIWRVLEAEGKAVFIVTNRASLWARLEHTPFGAGRPFSKTQFTDLLRQAKLTPTGFYGALHFPPVSRWRMNAVNPVLDRIGGHVWPGLCGVYIVEAVKRLYQGVPVKALRRSKVLVPALAPGGSGRSARD